MHNELPDIRIQIALATQRGNEFIELIAPLCTSVLICGSVRRGRPDPKDVEIVALPHHPPSFLNRIDALEQADTIRKYNYGNGFRWGAKYRGFIYGGVRLELFIADQHNLGFKQWLRTGPGKANTYVMSRLIKHQSIIRFHDGYGWHVTYDETHTKFDKKQGYAKIGKIDCADEGVVFKLFGFPAVIQPANRSVITYRRYLERGINTPAPKYLEAFYVNLDDEPRQLTMF